MKKRETLILLGKDKLFAFNGHLIEENYQDEESLALVLKQVKSEFKSNSLRVFLAPDLFYLDLISWPKNKELTENVLKQEIKALIPDNLDEAKLQWFSKESKDGQLVQFFAIKGDSWKTFKSLAEKLRFKINSHEPIFAPLLRLSKGKATLNLFSFLNNRLLVTNGLIYANSVLLAGNDEDSEEERLFAYVLEKWNLNSDSKQKIKVGVEELLKIASKQEGDCCQPKKQKSKLPIILVVLLLIFLVFSTLLFWEKVWQIVNNNKVDFQMPEKTLPTVVEPSITPTPTPQEAQLNLDRSTIKLKVLNGSGISGLAASLKEELLILGYEAENIDLGNAEESNYIDSELIVQTQKTEMADLLINDLKDKLDLATKFEDENISLENFDLIIIIGSKGETINEKE